MEIQKSSVVRVQRVRLKGGVSRACELSCGHIMTQKLESPIPGNVVCRTCHPAPNSHMDDAMAYGRAGRGATSEYKTPGTV